jgi:hypothetical protein
MKNEREFRPPITFNLLQLELNMITTNSIKCRLGSASYAITVADSLNPGISTVLHHSADSVVNLRISALQIF